MGIHLPESETLLCCARTCMPPERIERIKTLLRKGIDWDGLLKMAGRHGVIPLLHRSLKTHCSEMVPSPVLDQLRNLSHILSRRNLFYTGELLKLLNLFEANGIPAIPLKGPVLAESVYGDCSLRQFGDLDILTHEHNLLKARDLLISQGYRFGYDLKTENQQKIYFKSRSDFTFIHDTLGTVVELHRGITNKSFFSPFDSENVWKRIDFVPVTFAGKAVPQPIPEDLLLILCVHGSKHRWSRLGWICDVAELIRHNRELDWERTLRKANALKGTQMLFLGLRLATELIGCKLPKEVSRKVKSDVVVQSLAHKICGWLFQENDQPLGFFEKNQFNYKLKESLRNGLKQYVRGIFAPLTPSEKDLEFTSLSENLYFLYYFLRPIRLFRAYGLSSLKRLLFK